jgi:hypothetical protein
MEVKVSIGTCVQEYPDFVAGASLQGGLGLGLGLGLGFLEDKFSVTGSMI